MRRVLARLVVGLLALVLLLVGGLAAVAWLVDLDALVERYRPTAVAAASKALDREVRLERARATWFPVLGVRLEGLEVGDAPLDAPEPTEAPFLTADAVQVGVAVWPALVSLGRDIEITTVRVEAPSVRLVRRADGQLNVSTLGGTATATPTGPAEAPPGEPGVADRFTSAVIGEVALVDGRVRYIDETSSGAPIRIDRIALSAADVGLGRPVVATLEAAVGDLPRPNVRLELGTGPLAQRVSALGAPALERLAVRLDGLRPEALGVELPTFAQTPAVSADLTLTPSGSGYGLAGTIEAADMILDGTPVGQRFDGRIDLAAKTSTAFDRLVLDGTRVGAGALSLELTGTVRPLAPTWREVRVRTVEPVALARWLALLPGPPLELPDGRVVLTVKSSGGLDAAETSISLRWDDLRYRVDGLRTDGRATLDLALSGALARPRVRGQLDLGALSLEGEGFAKPAGTAAAVDLAIDVEEDRLRIGQTTVQLADARMVFEGAYPLGAGAGRVDVELAPLVLGPFLDALRIPSGPLPEGSSVELEARYEVGPEPGRGQVKLTRLDYRAGESRFFASGAVEQFDPLRAKLSGRSPFLDLDALLPPASETEEAPPEPTPSDEPLLPPSLSSARVVTTLGVKRLRYAGLEMRDVDVRLVLDGGVLTAETTQVRFLGGRFVADGTRLEVSRAPLRYAIKAELQGLRGNEVLDRVLGLGEALQGELGGELDLTGEGLDLAALGSSLTGGLELAFTDGRFDGVDLVSATLGPLGEALRAVQTTGLSEGKKLSTDFRRLAGRFEVSDGRLLTKRPLELNTRRGDFRFEGGIGLDGQLDLQGRFDVPAARIRSLTRGKVRPRGATPLSFQLGCSVTQPCVRGVNAEETAASLLKSAAVEAIGNEVGEKLGGRAGDAVEAIVDPEARAKAEAEAKAQAEAAKRKAEAEAKARAEAAKRKAEEAAKRKAEEARKKAEEEAKKRLKGLFGN